MSESKSISQILAERGKRYGSFVGNARIAQCLKRQMAAEHSWKRLTEDQREALEMIAHKIARILNGDPDYVDNWVDIAGYAKLVSDRLSNQLTAEEFAPQNPSF